MENEIMPKVDALMDDPIFDTFDQEIQSSLARYATTKHYTKGQSFWHAGCPAEELFALGRGVVRLFVRSGGDEQVLSMFRAPALFGETELLSGIARLSYAEALSDCEVQVIPKESFLQLIKSDSQVAMALSIDLASKLAITTAQLKSVAFDPITMRLANLLLDYVEWALPRSAAPAIGLTQDQMASALGVARRSIAEDLMLWRREGIIERRGKWYVIRSIEALRRYSDPASFGQMHRSLGARVTTVHERLDEPAVSKRG
jgi:CRP/FNR family cyclic AMP-dependent transcriptional regulator